MQSNIRDATVYITYLQLGYNLHADALKFDFKLTTNKLMLQKKKNLGTFSTATGKKDAKQQKFESTC